MAIVYGWQPMSTAPKEGTILIWDGVRVASVERSGNYWVQVSDSGRATEFDPIAWQPTPEPPHMKGNE